MGMFDYLICLYPLPDLPDPSKEQFQTKDTDKQYLETYTIERDGTLTFDGKAIEHHGVVEFYSSNVCMSGLVEGGASVATNDDSLPYSRNYTALYDHGKLIRMEGGLNPDAYKDRLHLTRDEMHRSWAKK